MSAFWILRLGRAVIIKAFVGSIVNGALDQLFKLFLLHVLLSQLDVSFSKLEQALVVVKNLTRGELIAQNQHIARNFDRIWSTAIQLFLYFLFVLG